MDNKPLEIQATSFIKSQLIKHGFEVHSELSYDYDGTDFLISNKLDETTLNFIKIQSKGRNIKKTTSVKIPVTYINKNFVLFCYIIDSEKNEYLYVLFSDEIKLYENRNGFYYINFTANNFKTKFEKFLFNDAKVILLRKLFKELGKPNYTSLLIDGVFLEESIKETIKIYKEVWPDKEFKKPNLRNIIKYILSQYNRFDENENHISCYLYLSNNHSLEKYLKIDKNDCAFLISENLKIRIYINKSKGLIPILIMEEVKKLNKVDNIIFIANHIIYEYSFKKLKKLGVENIIVMRLKTGKRDNEMFVDYNYGDISYPIGKALGLENHEL